MNEETKIPKKNNTFDFNLQEEQHDCDDHLILNNIASSDIALIDDITPFKD